MRATVGTASRVLDQAVLARDVVDYCSRLMRVASAAGRHRCSADIARKTALVDST
jgi:hypothetical protein